MRVFLTGSTGFIGSALTQELLGAGHQVVGLTRSEAGKKWLTAIGAEAIQGDIEDHNNLRNAAAECDGIIHVAFDHNFANFVANCEKDRRTIAVLGSALQGSSRPLIITSSTAMGIAISGEPATEDHFNPEHPNPRVASELAGQDLLQHGVNVSVVRLSQIHNTCKQGLVSDVIELARKKRVSASIQGVQNRWSATHLLDAVRLYRLALEKGAVGARYHATAEEAIPFRTIAEAIGVKLDVPVAEISPTDAMDHFGWLAAFTIRDMSATSMKTQQLLNWHPTGPSLIADIEHVQLNPD